MDNLKKQRIPALPTFDSASSAPKVGAILRSMDDATQLHIAALDYSERAQLLIHVQAWCDRFTAYHAEGRRTHSAAG